MVALPPTPGIASVRMAASLCWTSFVSAVRGGRVALHPVRSEPTTNLAARPARGPPRRQRGPAVRCADRATGREPDRGCPARRVRGRRTRVGSPADGVRLARRLPRGCALIDDAGTGDRRLRRLARSAKHIARRGSPESDLERHWTQARQERLEDRQASPWSLSPSERWRRERHRGLMTTRWSATGRRLAYRNDRRPATARRGPPCRPRNTARVVAVAAVAPQPTTAPRLRRGCPVHPRRRRDRCLGWDGGLSARRRCPRLRWLPTRRCCWLRAQRRPA